jgi:hypothetical protein
VQRLDIGSAFGVGRITSHGEHGEHVGKCTQSVGWNNVGSGTGVVVRNERIIVRHEELEWLGHSGHGRGGRTDMSGDLRKCCGRQLIRCDENGGDQLVELVVQRLVFGREHGGRQKEPVFATCGRFVVFLFGIVVFVAVEDF